MSYKRSGEWLDANESDGSDASSDHSTPEKSRGSTLLQRPKRRRVSILSTTNINNVGEHENAGVHSTVNGGILFDAWNSVSTPDNVEGLKPSLSVQSNTKGKLHRQAMALENKITQTGVIYLSRVPPFMKPQKVKHLLSSFGAIGRIFLTPEDATTHTRRVKQGGNKKRSFADGWVEFISKKDAKLVAEALNAQPIGGKKGNWYHDDVWNIKYLKGFKWHDLTEQIASQDAAIADRLRREIAQTTKETTLFLENIERSKMLENIKAKKSLKNGENRGKGSHDASVGDDRPMRRFAQNNLGTKKGTTQDKVLKESTKQILSKIL